MHESTKWVRGRSKLYSKSNDGSYMADRPSNGLKGKLTYFRWLPTYLKQRLVRRLPRGPIHVILTIADHFEPAIVPGAGSARASYDEQERRLQSWCRDYPRAVGDWRDTEGFPLRHTYFYPAEQYDKALIGRLAEHCNSGWGEIEVHLHHGMEVPGTAEDTRRQLIQFRDALAEQHGCLAYDGESETPRYAFVHGNFALANSAGGYGCGVDYEMEILAETGCYADLTLPASTFHPAQIAKINSFYECGFPLRQRAPHREGRDLKCGLSPAVFPIILQGPLMLDFWCSRRGLGRVENGALTGTNPPSLCRLQLWKQAAIGVQGRPDWIFIKLHCHGMDPGSREAVLGGPMQNFLRELVERAPERNDVLHFVTAREMLNITLAACDGKSGNPGDYRDYRFKRSRPAPLNTDGHDSNMVLKG
jgi:hypothetical protein